MATWRVTVTKERERRSAPRVVAGLAVLLVILGVAGSCEPTEDRAEAPAPPRAVAVPAARVDPPAPRVDGPMRTADPGLGLSYADALGDLRGEFAMQSSPLADGTPRMMGQSATGIIEFIGPSGSISSAYLMVIFAKDDPATAADNLLMMAKFANNLCPGESPPAAQFAVRAAPEVAQTENGTRVRQYGNRQIAVSSLKSLGALTVKVTSATPAVDPVAALPGPPSDYQRTESVAPAAVPAPSRVAPPAPVAWNVPVRIGELEVRVTAASLGGVVWEKSLSGTQDFAVSTPYLRVTLEVKNVGSLRAPYVGGGLRASARDDRGVPCGRAEFGVNRVKGQLLGTRTLAPGESVSDVIVFGILMDSAKRVTVEIPAEHFAGGEGTIRFVLPRPQVKK